MRRLARGAVVVAVEALAITREAVMIPLRMWMSAAEAGGAVTLRAWRLAQPLLAAATRALAAFLRAAERVATPGRSVTLVAIAAAALLAAAQFADYRGVQIGAPEYSGVSAIAPPPETGERTPADEHGVALLAVAAASVALAFAAAAGRPRLGRMLMPLGGSAIVVILAIDAPRGLDEGTDAIAYQGAHAVLHGAFWAELAAAATLALCGGLLPRYLAAERRARSRSRAGRSRLATGPARRAMPRGQA